MVSVYDSRMICTYKQYCVLINDIQSVLGRVHNCVGERALRCEMVTSSYVYRPNHSYVDCLFHLHSDFTRGLVVAGVLHCVKSELPHQGNTVKYYVFICL